MKKQKKSINSILRVLPFIWATLSLTFPREATANTSGFAYEDEYAALLSRMVEKGVKSPDEGDFLGPVGYWQELWDRVSSTDTWEQMMNEAVLITKSSKEYDGSTGKTYALLTLSEGVAWLAFPGVSTDANLESGAKGGFITWPGNGNTDTGKDVQQYFYAEWKSLEAPVTQWLNNNRSNFDKLIVTGHSKGGVLSQYFLADYADDLSDKDIHFMAFGAPNGGSEAFIQEWAARSALKRAKFYTTYGSYTRMSVLGKETITVDDIITWNEADEMGGLLSIFGSGEHYYPRGLSRTTDKYIADCAENLARQKIKVSRGLFTDYPTKEDYAFTIHDDSYYLSGLQDAYDQGQVDPLLPNISPIRLIHLAKDQTKCIDLANGNTAKGTNIQLVQCKDNPAQQWIMEGATIYLAQNLNKCLDVDQSGTANGTNIQLWDCNGTDAQNWMYDVARQSLRSALDYDKCLDLTQGNTTGGTNIQLYSCNNTGDQQWIVEGLPSAMPTGPDQEIHLVMDQGKCVDVKDGRTADGTNIQVKACNNGNSQYFTFDGRHIKMQSAADKCIGPNPNSQPHAINVILATCTDNNLQEWIYDGFAQAFRSGINTNMCLDVKGSNFNDGTNIQLWECNGTDAQQFEIY